MKPLAFHFKEKPKDIELDFSLIKYDEQLNLSVHKITRQPAIEGAFLDTETFTKAEGECSDSDRNMLSSLMDTHTFTRGHDETSDTDRNSLKTLIDTETGTFTHSEQSDSDRDRMATEILMDASTLIESAEAYRPG